MNNHKAVLLLVDDQPANLLSLEGLLASKERMLLTATSGRDALQIALNKNVDLIILDVKMPDMDGFEVANILKSNKRTRDIPIIFATAESKEHRFVMQGYDEGGIDYLFKPLNPDIVKAKVAVSLKIQLQKKELMEKNNSLQRKALLINNSADIIGIIDADTFRIEEINDAFFSILGYSEKEVAGTSLDFFLPQEDRAVLPSLKKQAREQFSFETRIYGKDRSIKWLQWRVVSRSGKWFVNARDITEIKEVEKIRNYLATVVKQSSDAIYIHDHEGRIISWNEGAEKIYGYTEEEALKMKIWNIIPEYMQAESGEIVNEVIYGKKVQDLETRRITKHGKLIDVLFSASVIAEAGDQQVSIAITERDITRQKRAEEKLKENEQFLKSILHNMADAVIVTSAEGRPVLLNPAAETILGNNKVAGIEQWAERYGLYYPHSETPYPAGQLPLVQAIKGKDAVRAEVFIRNERVPEGIHVIASASALKDDDARITGGVCVLHDITEKKKAEVQIRQLNEELTMHVRQLEATNKELESFTYSVSHDLRAPLRGLNGYSAMLEEDFGDVLNDEGKRLLSNIQRNAHRMGVLIDDLLAFSRLGRKEVQKSEVNMKEMVGEVLQEVGNATGHHAAITMGDLPEALADGGLLRQVWINLISNAIKYSGKKEDPRVDIGAFRQEGAIVYFVRDNGTGFNMKYADKLFGVFQRLHHRDEFEGTGIGLAIVHRIITKHGGSVWAEAKEQEGATFYFTLPKTTTTTTGI